MLILAAQAPVSPVTGIFISVIVRHCYTLVTVRHQRNFATATTGVSFNKHSIDYECWVILFPNPDQYTLKFDIRWRKMDFQKKQEQKSEENLPLLV